MRLYFHYDLIFLSLSFKARLLRPLEYVMKFIQTLFLLVINGSKIIWVQIPPTPLLYAAYLYRAFVKGAIVIADCHNPVFDVPWISFPGALALLKRVDIVLVHNRVVQDKIVELGLEGKNVLLLEDLPASINCDRYSGGAQPNSYILFPCSFDRDEPIESVFEAALRMPEITLYLSGKIERATGLHDLSRIPENVSMIGYLPKDDFEEIFCNASAVLALTRFDDVQVSVASEAVGAEKPLIISGTNLLRSLFNKGAVYVDSFDPESIARGCRSALRRKNDLMEEMKQLKIDRCERWARQASKVEKVIRRKMGKAETGRRRKNGGRSRSQ